MSFSFRSKWASMLVSKASEIKPVNIRARHVASSDPDQLCNTRLFVPKQILVEERKKQILIRATEETRKKQFEKDKLAEIKAFSATTAKPSSPPLQSSSPKGHHISSKEDNFTLRSPPQTNTAQKGKKPRWSMSNLPPIVAAKYAPKL